MNFPKSYKVDSSRPLITRHVLYINQEMHLAQLCTVQNCYFLIVLLQQQCISEYSIESSEPKVLQKHLFKFQDD